MNKKALLSVGLSFFLHLAYGQWNPDAGVVPSYTEGNSVRMTATSGISTLSAITDGDLNTKWTSDSPLPANFISRKDLNTFLGIAPTHATSSGVLNYLNVTDADVNTAVVVPVQQGYAWITLTFDSLSPLAFISLKCAGTAPIGILSYTSTHTVQIIDTLQPSDNYQWKRFAIPAGKSLRIQLISTQAFMVYELAGLADLPTESITVDLGQQRPIGKVYTRHWCGTGPNGDATAERATLSISADGVVWTKIADLIPDALSMIVTDLEQEKTARFVKIEYSLKAVDYYKVFFWEIDVYDRWGKFGTMPPARKSAVNIRQLLGVSGIWGWGHNRYSDLLQPGEGPDLHAAYASHARNYHSMNWDVYDPDHAPDYEAMAQGMGTEVQWWLNWDREYAQWVEPGMDVTTSIQFYQFADNQWDTPSATDTLVVADTTFILTDTVFQAGDTLFVPSTVSPSAYQYGYNFARHFGPTHGNGLVGMMEVGNEPWAYDSTIYRRILRGMAMGIKAADPMVKVLPCALQATDPEVEHFSATSKNYMGTRIPEDIAPYLDGLNVHTYSYVNKPDGMRAATHPEHENSVIREMLSAIRFRDHNMPGKPVYCTEWGWDHDGAGEDCTHNECVSEQAATAYATRGALMFLRMGVSQATWFFYANSPNPSFLYRRSGVTGSINSNFAKKRTFYALETLVNTIGDKHFLSIVREDNNAWMYLLGNADSTVTHLIAWRPVAGDNMDSVLVKWTTNYHVIKTLKIDGLSANGTLINNPTFNGNTMSLYISAMPILVELSAQPLPVELANFNATCKDGEVQLRWEALTTGEAEIFSIQASEDGKVFKTIATLPSAKPSTQLERYDYSLPAPSTVHYYRLHWSEQQYSNLVPVDCEQKPEAVSMLLYPNPSDGSLYVQLETPETPQQVEIQILQATGRIMHTSSWKNARTISFSKTELGLSSGAYFIKVMVDGREELVKKLVIR